MENKKIILIVLATLIIGAGLGWLIKPTEDKTNEISENHSLESLDHQEIWTCSMHPQIRQSEPGACPICGMELIPLKKEDLGADPDSYQMSENAMKLANITSEIVGMGNASKELRLNGKIQVDERNAYSQSTHIPGRVESLSINFTGEKVSRGQTLAMVYSPELVTAQEELLQAASIKESQPELFEAAKEKLKNWKIGNTQIDRILANGKAIQRFPIGADVNGIVTEKMVELGDYVERGMPIYEISDLSKVWVLFDLYESELAWVKEGSKISYTVNSLPGETFEGTISFIDPIINSQTRVASARVEVNNKDGRLKPEMFVSGIIKNDNTDNDTQELVIPKSAVLWTGKRSVVYIKETVDGRSSFKLREIVLGPGLGDSYVVEEGLNSGEEIVTNGTFTVDAAVQLSGRPSMMSPREKETQKTNKFISVTLSEKEKQQFEPILSDYLEFKDALVADDFSSAKKLVIILDKRVKMLKTSELKEESAKIWGTFQKELIKSTQSMISSNDLQEMRNNFDELSETTIGMVNSFKLTSKELFVLHCPMANSNKGAFWLSESSDVKNPYYGSAMLTCGEVKSTLK
ncbi:Cu(I)/Ag(I) efflux system membrane fusion protein [Gillisia mitskevichiae]|uniref:Cu(I)/Ag(I) efflux system membrane fusion protein n=1 Tax=Gillisia mitskevichiae TaxID=270921 RepID=A0A495PW88_9FLAO|nr:efflux RND transporter periplasmic adaptor subunit [Gillisia mitskevichiae]RKS55068.1 Cu(I)/Ag(I) efflux system membrane fusion protein [Gillisia mitskevichiae]